MRLEFTSPTVPDTPDFWRELESELKDVAVNGPSVIDIRETPAYDDDLTDQLSGVTRQVARRERLPIGSLAAAAAAVLALAAFLTLKPSDATPLTAATPGSETTTTLASTATAEDLVVASFQRWIDGRTEEERVTNRLINEGYDVVIRRLNVAEPSLNGQVLAVRHGVGRTSTTIAQPRGQVEVVIGRTLTAGENLGG